jgi:hypothetical protein
MERRDVTVTLPDGKTRFVIESVPIDCLCSQLRIHISATNRVTGDFLLYADGRLCNDIEVLSGDEVFVKFPSERIDHFLQFVFLIVHIIPLVLLILKRALWQIIIAEFVALVLFRFFQVIRAHPEKIPGWEGTLGTRQALAHFWALFLRSLKPSFRLEHLIKHE